MCVQGGGGVGACVCVCVRLAPSVSPCLCACRPRFRHTDHMAGGTQIAWKEARLGRTSVHSLEAFAEADVLGKCWNSSI